MQILIVKTSALGDIIHAFPVLEWIKSRWPSAGIDWVVEQPFAELVRAHPLVNEVIALSSKSWRRHPFAWGSWKKIGQLLKQLRHKRYDLVLDLQGNTKSGLVTFCSKGARKAGFDWGSAAEWPNCLVTSEKYAPPRHQNIRQDYLYIAKKALGEGEESINFEPSPRLLQLSEQERRALKRLESDFLPHESQRVRPLSVLVSPSSTWSNKQLSEGSWQLFLENFLEKEPVHFFFIWGSEKEKAFAEAIIKPLAGSATLLERLSLPCLQHFMSQMDLVLAVDSLPLHLAGATATPTYSFFGPSLAEKYRPIGRKHGSFQGACPYGERFEKRCPYLRSCSTAACIKGVEEGELLSAFYRWFSENFPKKTTED